MNIITGTTKTYLGISFGLLILMTMGIACTPATQNQETEAVIRSDVKVTTPIVRTVYKSVTFKGITKYLQTNTIRTQVSGIVKAVNCQPAGAISTNQPLFAVLPIEAAALQKSNFKNEEFRSYLDTIFSHLNGIISNLNVQVGDFVQAGDVLATCFQSNSIRIIAYAPMEQLRSVKPGMNCTIVLPEGNEIAGKLVGQWPSAMEQNQTQPLIIKLLRNISLSENIDLTVRFQTGQLKEALLIPQSALLGNEEQTDFWVMKMTNDSTCVKIPVEKGLETDSFVQLLHSNLFDTDKLVSEGGYGLPDTASVRVIK